MDGVSDFFKVWILSAEVARSRNGLEFRLLINVTPKARQGNPFHFYQINFTGNAVKSNLGTDK